MHDRQGCPLLSQAAVVEGGQEVLVLELPLDFEHALPISRHANMEAASEASLSPCGHRHK
jgi:hypothetical protein